ncbi:MAG: molybdenum cofactor guanylyltransferase [Gammaproteobacteria bacterium]|nr:MAG: molybdenum cofactor guanylyltransferase [Gammaproteobacteria bacterium]
MTNEGTGADAGKPRVPPLYGLVLAGGRSRRFGSDKAALQIEGRALLERTIGLLRPAVETAYVSVRADQVDDALRSRFPMIADELPGLGPAGGILAAHGRHPQAAWLVLACDLPGLSEAAIRILVQSRDVRTAATAYRSPADGLIEPLCAIYEPATLARFQREAAAGEGLSPREFLSGVAVHMLEPTEADALINVNTPADLLRLGK